ncbi:hypothetical protein RDI58_004621 [Solanum bulbocastanum]|uniref:Uncharacterized protein n=1 Tax=Solanum bulbocastanum TaxID=147425 RepID=A0AAN8TZ46_SOLBU
MQERVNYREE